MNANSITTRGYGEIWEFVSKKNKANSSAFSVLRSADNPGTPGEDLKKQSQFNAPTPTKGVGKGKKSLAAAKSLTG
jgi:hypothetical protein